MAYNGSDGKSYADGTPDNKGTIGKSWSAAEITAQTAKVRAKVVDGGLGQYWHPTLGGVTVAQFALLTAAQQLACLPPL